MLCFECVMREIERKDAKDAALSAWKDAKDAAALCAEGREGRFQEEDHGEARYLEC